jgi:chromosome segregation ATPase
MSQSRDRHLDIDEDKLVKDLYKKYKNNHLTVDDYAEAIALLKKQRRRLGSLQGWNNRYRVEIAHLKQENATLQQLQQQVDKQKKLILKLTEDKTALNQQMREAIQELEEYEKKIHKVQLAYEQASGTDGTLTLWERLNVLLLALKELFSPTPLPLETKAKKITGADEDFSDKPQMRIDPAAIGRALLDD